MTAPCGWLQVLCVTGRHQILVCGPPKFMALVSGEKTKDGKQGELSGLLRDLKYEADQVFKY